MFELYVFKYIADLYFLYHRYRGSTICTELLFGLIAAARLSAHYQQTYGQQENNTDNHNKYIGTYLAVLQQAYPGACPM